MKWFYAKDGQQIGPVEYSEIQRLQTEGQLTGDSLVWEQGSPNWVKLSTVQNPGASSAPSLAAGSPVSPIQEAKTNVLSIVSLVLGIIGIPCCGLIIGAAAAICGHIALGQIKTTGENGKGLATAGLILGYIGVALSILGLIFYMIMGAAGAVSEISVPSE